MIIPIDAQSVAVEYASDLSDVVSVNSAITHVYLAKDITLMQGVTIHPGRTLLVLDGEYPIGSGVIHTLTDQLSNSILDTIGVRAASGVQITIQNMNMIGRNYYGMPYITDLYDTSGVSVTYNNITYSGRQITYNCNGLTRYIDCNITVATDSGYSGEEVGEVCRVEIGGKTTMSRTGSLDAVFYFHGSKGGDYLTILRDADVTITTQHYFMFASGRTIPYTIEPGANFTLGTSTGISYASAHQVSPFVVGENASFTYSQSSASTGIYIPGTFTVKQGARVFMRADYTGTLRLIDFTTSGTQPNLVLQNPKSFVIVKPSSPAMTFASSRPFSLGGGQVNYWSSASTGSFSDPPLYAWHNPDWSNFAITGNAGATTTGQTSTLTPPVSPPLSNLTLQSARILSVGDLPLTVNPVLDDGLPITGQTDPYAKIMVVYTDAGGTHTITGITADADGNFSAPTPAPVPPGTSVAVSCNVPYLYRTASVISQATGELYIDSAPDRIRFVLPRISAAPLVVLGREANEPVVVIDTRATGSRWELLATIDGPLYAGDGEPLPGEVVYVPTAGGYSSMQPLSAGVARRVYVGGPNTTPTIVVWGDDMGLLLNVTGPVRLAEEYTATITWAANPISG